MKRRRFLKVGLWGSAALVAAGAGLSLWPSLQRYRPKRALAALDGPTFNVLAAAAARVVPADGDPIEIAHLVDDALALGSAEAQADFRKLLKLLENGLAGLILDGRPRNFTRLSPEAQDAALLHFRDSRIVGRRAGYHALRKLCLGAYYAGESTWAAIGYGGPPQIAAPL
jgi:hypothetical protein